MKSTWVAAAVGLSLGVAAPPVAQAAEVSPYTLRDLGGSSDVGDVSYVQTGLHNGERVIAKNPLLVYDELND